MSVSIRFGDWGSIFLVKTNYPGPKTTPQPGEGKIKPIVKSVCRQIVDETDMLKSEYAVNTHVEDIKDDSAIIHLYSNKHDDTFIRLIKQEASSKKVPVEIEKWGEFEFGYKRSNRKRAKLQSLFDIF